MRHNSSYLFILVIIIIRFASSSANWDPYEVIGVQRDASLDQIKKAYRELARKIHPDKSNLNEEESNKRFIELNKAFDILKDPDKRGRYDQHGDIGEGRHGRSGYQNHHNSAYHDHRQTREYWTSSGDGHKTFRFYSSSSFPDSYLRKKSISARQYLDYLKISKTKLFLIFFYSDFCPSCNSIEGRWSKIVDELARFNIDSFSINVHHEPRLSHDLGINSIPHIACLIDGELKTYNTPELSLSNIVTFVRNLVPVNLVKLLITEEDQDKFIALGPQQNKLSAIIIHNESNLKLRYLLLAYEFKTHYRFGQVSTTSCQYKAIAEKYNLTVSPNKSKKVRTSLLIFDENILKPTLALNFDQPGSFDMDQIRSRLARWPFLKLPKLSSQQKFDDLCLYNIPKDGFKTSTRICVILFATDTPSSQLSRTKLIEFIEANGFVHDNKVSFAYIDTNKQRTFVESLLSETIETTYPFKKSAEQDNSESSKIDNSIIMIERHQQNSRKAVHRWLSYRWDPKKLDQLDKAKLELYDYIKEYKRNRNIIETKVALDLLIDEDGPTLADRIFWRFVDQILRTTYYITSRESFSTVMILIMCALITSLLLYQLPSSGGPDDLRSSFIPEERQRNLYYASKQRQFTSHDNSSFQQQREQQSPTRLVQPTASREDELKVIELKAETYNGMIRLLKPGYRSIVVLIDHETKDKLLVKFRAAVWPYRRNKTLLFGYLCLDKNLIWYRCLLEQVLGINDLNVNKKNCIGTVLSLNGFKKYFRVYHAKHHEIDHYDNEIDNDGSFLGFNEDRDSDGDENHNDVEVGPNTTGFNETYTVDKSLDRLPIWLDKMFDGLTKRYFLDSWPDLIN